jgi:hypothetical protein
MGFVGWEARKNIFTPPGDRSMTYIRSLLSIALMVFLTLNSRVAMGSGIEQASRSAQTKLRKTEVTIAQSVYQDKVWPSIKQHVPNAGNRKSLICVFSKTRNLAPYNSLLEDLYRESFGDGVAEKVSDFLSKNSHDFTYQFHMQALDNGNVRINAFDTRDRTININYIVDFYPDERYDFISYGKLPNTDKSQKEILQIYKTFLPGVLQKKCIQNYQYLER